MSDQLIITLANVILTPILVVVTLWVKGSLSTKERREKREDGFIDGLEERIILLEKRLDSKEREIREIRMELKNRDVEYITLYKEHTTLKAKYDILEADHDELRKQYAVTSSELDVLKRDMMKRTEVAVHTMKNLEQTSVLTEKEDKQ